MQPEMELLVDIPQHASSPNYPPSNDKTEGNTMTGNPSRSPYAPVDSSPNDSAQQVNPVQVSSPGTASGPSVTYVQMPEAPAPVLNTQVVAGPGVTYAQVKQPSHSLIATSLGTDMVK